MCRSHYPDGIRARNAAEQARWGAMIPKTGVKPD
jgi:hypothetical protein